jgi:hypothetical protein
VQTQQRGVNQGQIFMKQEQMALDFLSTLVHGYENKDRHVSCATNEAENVFRVLRMHRKA